MRALTIAATGMNAQTTNVEVIANNIANINTTGFKRARAEFTDLLYETQRLQGVSSRGNQGVVPEGAQLGLGVKTAAIRNLHIQGVLTQTGNQFDLAVQGRGWFQVTDANGNTNYTRAGSFNTNAQGQLVTLDGNLVTPNIVVPPNTTAVTVSQSGIVSATVAGKRHAGVARAADARQFRQRRRVAASRQQSLSRDDRIRHAGRRCARRSRHRHGHAGLPRGFERRSCGGNHQPHLGAARLRDETPR